ncbi:hypothetical protein KC19_11G000200 [Ceratodon purpureus]|uniref:TOG domain-containing protein n=1 Tax=Ceratodon purpureus TaxID=3225 RepID=A0A8T0GBJ6_CERPU|nr:hypothetical protein KC19_11G000200 [Ceratodon purpureus]
MSPSADDSATSLLLAAHNDVSSASTNRRIALFRNLARTLPGEAINKDAPEVVDVIFSTLPLYDDRHSQAAVVELIIRGLEESTFIKVFAGVLVQNIERSHKNCSDAVRLKLLRWSCLLVGRVPTLLSAKSAFCRLAAAQGFLLASLYQGPVRLRRATTRIFIHYLSNVKGALECYIAEVENFPVESNCGIMKSLLLFCTQNQSLLDSHKAWFLQSYLKLVFNSTNKKPLRALSEAFQPLLEQLSHEDFGKIILPSAIKMLKRNPELVMEAFGLLLTYTKLDLSQYSAEILPSILLQSRHSDEARRRESLQLATQLVVHSSDLDAISTMFQSVKSLLAGAEGKLVQAYQRVAMVNILQILSTVNGGKTVSSLASASALYLMSLYKDDGNEEVRVAILAALGAWLSRVASSSPAECVKFFSLGLKEKDTLRRAHLRCLRLAFQNSDILTEMMDLTSPLVQLIKTGATKPALRVDAIYSFFLVSKVAAVHIKASDILVKEKTWDILLDKNSSLVTSTLVSKLLAEDCVILAELIEVVLLQHSSRILAHSDGMTTLSKLLVNLLWHPAQGARRAAEGVVLRAQKADDFLSEALFDALSVEVSTFGEQCILLKSCDAGESVGGATVNSIPNANLLAKTLLIVSSTSLSRKPSHCARLLLLAHNPCIATGGHKDVIWKTVCRKMKRLGLDMSSILASDPLAVCEVLLGSSGLVSANLSESQAAMFSLETAMRVLPDSFFPVFIQKMDLLGDRHLHDSLSSQDIKIFNTEEGMLSSELGVYVAEAVMDRNVRGARGRFKMYGDDEEVGKPSPVSRQIDIGKKDVTKGVKKSSESDKARSAKEEARELKIQEEYSVRKKVEAIKRKLSLVLRALGLVAVANPAKAHEQLPALVDRVFPLLKSPLASAEAYETVEKLVSCVAAPRDMGPDIAASLKMVAAGSILDELQAPVQLPVKDANQKPGVVDRVVTSLVQACKNGPIPPPSFTVLYPVLEQIMLAEKKTRLHDDVLAVLALHTSPRIPLPRTQMLSVLYHVLGCVPSYHSRIVPLLNELCEGLEPENLAEALNGLYSEFVVVRIACLNAVKHVPSLGRKVTGDKSTVTTLLWMALHDPDKSVAEVADEVWDFSGYDETMPESLQTDYAKGLMVALAHANSNVRLAAAEAIAAGMYEFPATVAESLNLAFSLYIKELPIIRSEVDNTWYGRHGVGLLLHASADVLTQKDLPVVITFLISRALADTNQVVRSKMVEAGVAIIDKQGSENVGLLLPILENYLDKKAADEERYDLVREGVVIFMGALAKHLSLDASKGSIILERLLEVLNTPSEAVQRAVSDCLPPLMPSQKDNAAVLVANLLHRLKVSDKYGERRGAAFGLAGVVKGFGLPSIKRFKIMEALRAGVDDKASAKTREGALLGFECLCEKLGRLFEPYVIHILPVLLICFSDPVVAVRDATDAAARAIMSQLSGPGVKLVLPALMKGLEDKAWRTKQGSVQVLGAMAFCAPRQLSQCLPTIVPKLSEVLTDTHPKVQSAAQTALQQVGSVIRNPEIAALVPTLLISIADPNEHTKTSLDLLLQTTFVNSVDAPSLALLVPIVHRGLRERSAETKKKAAQIVGNMSSLVSEHKDMLPYLSLLLPEVKKVLVDPIPEVRTVASRALGSLIKGMGDENFKDLVPWLLQTLKSETSSVERSGAAQGLSEVLAAMGTDYFESLLPDIITNCSHQRPAVREGYLTLFKYLPVALGPVFQKYLQKVLPAILDGLADENESVRDAALSAGHILVEHYATSSLPLLLPAVEEGIFNDNWRIRQSSVELLGDLLFKVAGTSGKVVIDGGSDDEGASTEAHGRAIVNILGAERRNEVLAAVYMVRSDVSLAVRQASLHVWKTVVANTPKTLKEIMPVLMRTLIDSLASTSSERRQVAGRSLGELVRKLGERVLPSIIPILAKGLEDPIPSTRQGVCMGLSEVMGSAGKHQLVSYMGELIPTIRRALCDREMVVREAGGLAFSTLFKSAGMQAVDEIVPALLHALEDDDTSTTALDGLKQILSVRTAAVLPHILPKLVQIPLTAFNAHALGALAEVAGPGLNVHLSTLLPPLISTMGGDDESILPLARRAAETVVLAVDDDGLDTLLAELQRGLGDTQPAVRRGSAYLVGFFFKNTKLGIEEDVPTLLTTLVVMLTDNDQSTVQAAWEALGNVIGTVQKETFPSLLKVARDAVSTARDKERRKRKGGPILIPGFCLPKALQHVLPIYLQSLMIGSADTREQAADGLGELIDVTSEGSLKPFVVQITGPLIRIIGDRFPWQVKSSILATLGVLINKGGVALKPFLPQLQTTFIKCLQDNARPVRSKAAWALGKLTRLSTRVDPLVGDLLTGLQAAEGGVREATLVALEGVMAHAGMSVSAPVNARLLSSLQAMLSSEEDVVRTSAAKTLGIVSQHVGDAEFSAFLHVMCTVSPSQAWTLRHGCTLALASTLRHASARVSGSQTLLLTTVGCLKARAKDDKVPVREGAAQAISRLLVFLVQERLSLSSVGELLPVLCSLLTDPSSDVRRRALRSVKLLAKVNPEGLVPAAGPGVGECLQDSSAPVRLAAERCAFHLFQLSRGGENVQAAQKYITGLDARRIAKQPEVSDDSEDSEAESQAG